MSETANIKIEIIKTPQNIRRIYNEFNKNIFENKYFINLEYLMLNSTSTQFQQIWNYNPYRFCLDIYGISEISPIIILVNKINSFLEFRSDIMKNAVITPDINSIYKVLIINS